MTVFQASVPLDNSELINLRMSALGLNRPERSSQVTQALNHVHRMFAIQGQDLPGTLWSIGNRTALTTRSDVEQLFASGELVRSWPFRGTLHVMSARNAALIMNYMAPRRAKTMAKWQAESALSQTVVAQARGILRETLQPGVSLSRAQIASIFEHEGIVLPADRYNNLVFQAHLYGDVVWGPIQGNEQRLVVAPWRLDTSMVAPLSDVQAEVEIVRGFVRGRGPSSMADVCYWTGLGKAIVGRALKALEQELVHFDWPGHNERLFMMAESYEAARAHAYPRALLNAGFDEFLLGYKERTPQLPSGRIDDVVPGRNGMFRASVVYRGKVVGTWSKTHRAKALDVTVTLFDGREPSAALAASLKGPIRRLALFLGQDVNLRF